MGIEPDIGSFGSVSSVSHTVQIQFGSVTDTLTFVFKNNGISVTNAFNSNTH